MSFESTRHSVDQSTCLDKKVIGCNIITISEQIYEDELIKNMIRETCYEVTDINPSSSYIPINVCLHGYDRNELCAYIDNGCYVYFGKKIFI